MEMSGAVSRLGSRAYARAGLDPTEVPEGGAGLVADGLHIPIVELTDAASLACLTMWAGVLTIVIRAGQHPYRLNFLIGHELAHILLGGRPWYERLRYAERELWCDRLGSWLCCPGPSFLRAVDDYGLRLASLSRCYALTQSAVAMRLAEEGLEPGVDVITPTVVHRRGTLPWPIARARELADGLWPHRLPITDEPGRVALVAA
jgi:hypothetical protein